MLRYSLLLVIAVHLPACSNEPLINRSEVKSQNIKAQSDITTTIKKGTSSALNKSERHSIQINGKKFLRDRNAASWRLYDIEFSQYVMASNSLVLSTTDLQASLAKAALTESGTQWRKIAKDTYQAEFDMKQIELIYRRLVKAQQQVEWLLDYSQQKDKELM